MRLLPLSLLVVSLISTVGLGWLFDRAYEHYLDGDIKQGNNVVETMESIGQQLALSLNTLPSRHQLIKKWDNTERYHLELTPLIDFPLPKELASKVKLGEPLLLETHDGLAFHFYLSGSDELLVLKTNRISAQQGNSSVKYLFTGIFYLLLLSVFLIWIFPLIRQLVALSKSAKSFGQGDLTARTPVSSTSYIKGIQHEFNHMAARIEQLVSDVKLLSNAVSHDLRTPLAKIRFGLDTLIEEDDPVTRKRFEKKISDNIDEMTELVETLLNYARLDQTMLNLVKENINLTELVKQCVQRQEHLPSKIRFRHGNVDVFISGDKSYVKMLVTNLLSNATNYGKGRITLSLIVDKGMAELSIADNGLGIEKHLSQNIFKPFVRGDNKQSNIKGYGIGLAFVKRIVEWHNGEVQLTHCDELGGAKFIVRLPQSGQGN